MPVSPARAAAFDILLRVERESSYAADLLHSAAYHPLSLADHALATELVMGVLRWRSRLDHEISLASSQRLSRLDLEILIALRLAVYQFRFLDRIPQRAALHESVELVKRARKRSAATFVNAVLRKLAQPQSAGGSPSGTPLCSSVPSVVSSSETVAETWSHPLWLVERWSREYGLAAAQKICQHNQSTPITTIRLRSPNAETALVSEGIQLLPGALLSSARRVQSGDITKTRPFRERQIVIQDEASQLVAALIGHGSLILDCCAAPGGKTLAIADQNPGSKITAVELHPHRARLLQKLLDGNARTQVIAADARLLPVSQPFDRILADVPCSGTGTLSRNPEIKWRLAPEDLPELHDRQLTILRAALAHLQSGGRLVYSTCSLEKEENEDVIDQALANDKSIHLRDCREDLDRLKSAGELTWPNPESLTRGAYLRTIPGIHPCDGFFAAILEKS
jgi:16S rRNA (cytosine967-C5)-methyltransferase